MACMNLQVQNCPLGCDSKINDLNKLNDNLDRLYNDCYIKVQAYQNAVKTLESQRAWYQNNQLAYEEKIRVLQRDLENTSNELKYSEKINAEIKMEKQDLQAKLDNSLSRFNKWKESSKNLAKLIDNSLSVKSKLGLGYKDYTGPNEIYYPEMQSIFDPEEAAMIIHFIIKKHVRFVIGRRKNASCESIPAEESLPKPAVIEPKTSENVVCKSKLSAESPEFIPQSVCSKNKNVKKTDKLRKNNKTPRGNQRGWIGMMIQMLGDTLNEIDTRNILPDLVGLIVLRDFWLDCYGMQRIRKQILDLELRDSTQSHYIEKILKKFNREDCSPESTPMDPVEKLMPNTGKHVDQIEYSRAIGCLMYAMTSTRPNIAYAMGGWVFLLDGGAISWASKKQTCITGSTIEYEFVALAAAGKEAE
ncbi:hypothetical protein Tco_0417318 [Tanacetum coccineum]